MKYLFVLFFMLTLSFTVSAQQKSIEEFLKGQAGGAFVPGMPVTDVISHVGSEVYIVDSVYSYKIVNKRLMYLYIGGQPSDPTLTIIVKGTDEQLNLTRKDWTKGRIHVSGKAIIFNGKPAIVVTDANQFSARIQI